MFHPKKIDSTTAFRKKIGVKIDNETSNVTDYTPASKKN